MDELGIDRALMWPTLASLLEERLRDDPPATHAVIHALNQWMHEHWTFNYENRIFPTPVINLGIVEQAIEELEWVLERGARIMLIRPAPVSGFMGPARRPCPSSTHSGSGSTRRACWSGCTPRTAATSATPTSGRAYPRRDDPVQGGVGVPWPSSPTRAGRSPTRWPRSSATGCAPGFPIFGSLRSRTAATGYARCSTPSSSRATPPRTPSTRTRWRCSNETSTSTPSTRRTRSDWSDLLGADRVLFGSDYPHPEGMADPISFVDELAGLPDDDVAKIMGGNMNRLMHLDVA